MSDIKMINGRYYDFSETNNESFTRTAKELKTLGIKNYYFMLEVKNPRIADIDPFKKNITRQEVEALMIEYRQNIWWFARTAVRMRTSKGVVPFCLHRGLTAVIWNFIRGQDNCICEPRQTYKTTGTIASCIQWAFQLMPNMQIHFFGKETENTKKNLSDLKSDIEELPQWLQFTKYDAGGKIKSARRSSEILENGLLKNKLTIHAKASSLSSAQSLGRGGSGNILYFDEIEHTLYFSEILANSAPLFKTSSENARAAGLPACRVFSCTPGNLDTREGREAYPIIKSMIPWSEKLYDMTEEQIREYKSIYKDEYHNSEEGQSSKREVIDVFYMEYQYYQVRKDYNWVLEQFALSGDKMAIRREILMQRLRGSTESPISPEDIEYLISNMKHAKSELIIDNKWLFKIYDHGAGTVYGRPVDLDPKIPYIVGCDPAGGGGGDNFAVTIINPFNLRIAAEFKNPYISGPNASRMLQTLVHEFIPKACIEIEKNSMGCYLIQMLLETDIRDNLYWWNKSNTVDDWTDVDANDRTLKELSAEQQKYGTYVGSKVRSAMFELLFQHIDQCKQLLTTEYLVDDLCKLVRTSTGRIEAAKGEHDDCVMSYLHCLYIYYNSDNLQLWGIDKLDHPVWGAIQVETNEPKSASEAEIMRRLTDPSYEPQRTYDEEVMENGAQLDNVIQQMIDMFPNVSSPGFKRNRNAYSMNDDTYDIPSSYFDSLNGLSGPLF